MKLRKQVPYIELQYFPYRRDVPASDKLLTESERQEIIKMLEEVIEILKNQTKINNGDAL